MGQHLVHDRTLSGVFLTASEVDGVSSNLIVSGPAQKIPSTSMGGQDVMVEMFGIPYSTMTETANGLVDWQPIAKNVAIQGDDPIDYHFVTDRLGRLIFIEYGWSSPEDFTVRRLDLTTLQTDDLGTANILPEGPLFLLSPGRTRIYTDGDGDGKIFELDGYEELGLVEQGQAAFVGEDLYYVSSSSSGGSTVNRTKANTQPEQLFSSSGHLGMDVIEGDRAAQLLLSLSTETGYSSIALLNTETLETMNLPAEKGHADFVSASSDGHWLLFIESNPTSDPNPRSNPNLISDDGKLFLFDWTKNAALPANSESYLALNSSWFGRPVFKFMKWRPGKSELWIPLDGYPEAFAVWRMGEGIKMLNKDVFLQLGMFTPDGKYWFSTNYQGHLWTEYVGSTENLEAPLLPLNPPGTSLSNLWQTGDGRFLVGASTTEWDRQDLTLIDPDTGVTQAIGNNGHLVAVSATRALALLNWEPARSTGDLTLIDLTTGAQTLLAQDVYAATLDPGTSADTSKPFDHPAPGARVAFLCRNRLESPYDGLWMAELP
jgi:hypothetical protein